MSFSCRTSRSSPSDFTSVPENLPNSTTSPTFTTHGRNRAVGHLVPRPDRENLALERLLLGGLGNEETPGGLFGLLSNLDEDFLVQRLQVFHFFLSNSVESFHDEFDQTLIHLVQRVGHRLERLGLFLLGGGEALMGFGQLFESVGDLRAFGSKRFERRHGAHFAGAHIGGFVRFVVDGHWEKPFFAPYEARLALHRVTSQWLAPQNLTVLHPAM